MTLRNIVIYIEAIDSKLLNEFYAKIGVNWLEMDDKLLYYACKKVILLLNKNNSQYSVTKLFFLTDSKDIKEFGASQLTLDSFEYLKDRLNSLNLLQLEQDTNKQIIPLLRVGDIEENKNKYDFKKSSPKKEK